MVALDPTGRRRDAGRRRPPRGWPRPASSSCWPGPTRPPGPPATASPGPAGYGDSRRRILVANCDGLLVADDQVRTGSRCRAWPWGTPVCRPASRRRPAPSASSCSTRVDGGGAGPRRGPSGAGQALGPAGPERARSPSCWPGAAGGSSSTRPAATGSRPTTSPRTPRSTWARSASRWPARWSPWSTTARSAASGGPSRSTTRADRPGATSSSRTASSPTTCGTTCGPARRVGSSSGNGRRQSYQHLPMVRMTNTFLLTGEDDPDEIVAQTPTRRLRGQARRWPGQHHHRGLRVRHHRGLPDRGRRITEPLRDANLIGNGPEVLRRIDAVANDFAMSPGHLRQGRAERAGRLRPGRPCGSPG